MIRRILLDLDDVCNQMTMYCLQHVGCSVDPMDNSRFPVACGYDIVAAANLLHPTKHDWTAPDFWEAIPREIWASAPESPEFPWLLEQCERLVGRKNVFIATSPTKDPDCLAGKLEWVHEHFPKWMWRQYAVTPRKHIGARPDTLLIDDSFDNCRAFNEAGGQALLVPKPWNPLHDCNTRDCLEEALNHINNLGDRTHEHRIHPIALAGAGSISSRIGRLQPAGIRPAPMLSDLDQTGQARTYRD